ncbi:unnamed protein product [Ostreobium quekettii]|uniref:Uncharacterized protein n=1 Tax=Ostreobium quekettii TaxID=121088 RepID=A0A8S1JBZ6_9CHLO|nr:unnamed protein product [Ostreobium quekettii]
MKFAAAVVLLLALASVASARSLGTVKKDPIYCSGSDYAKDECPEHYGCEPLDKKVCKLVKVCETDKYGKEKCTNKKQCFEYKCVEEPKYCDPYYTGEDECVEKYGKDLECKKLDKEACVYEKECKYVDTKVCEKYAYRQKCVYVPSKICLKYNQEQKCDTKQVCKVYKQEKVCKASQGKCTSYYNGKCTKYAQGVEKCEYVDTDECKVYETVRGECKYVNTTCKEYKQVKKCENVKAGCLKYKQEEVCEDVKVCWSGKCVEAPKKAYSFGK